MQFVKNMLTEQRKRLVGSLMQYLEDAVYPTLTQPQQQELRRKVLSSISQYHDVCLDMLKASVEDGSTVVNQEALQMIASMHRDIQVLRRGDRG